VASLEIDLPTTALILVDFTNGLLGVDMEPYSGQDTLANAVRLAEAFRAREGFVVLTCGAPPTPVNPGSQSVAPPAPIFERDMSPLAKVGQIPDAGVIASDLGPMPGDYVVRKPTWSAFWATDLGYQLHRRGIRTVVVGGIATNFGAEGTGRDARGQGYSVIFVEDAMRAITLDEHRHSCAYTLPMTGRVRTTAEVVGALETS
jgi:nicotinamidase-related amidase